MTIIYKAYDGRTFNTQYECEKYENQENWKFKIWDEEGHELSYTDGLQASYLFFTSRDELSAIPTVVGWAGSGGIYKPGLYHKIYIPEEESEDGRGGYFWMNAEYERLTLKETIATIESLLEECEAPIRENIFDVI